MNYKREIAAVVEKGTYTWLQKQTLFGLFIVECHFANKYVRISGLKETNLPLKNMTKVKLAYFMH